MTWRENAACRATDPTLFDPAHVEHPEEREARIHRAQTICRGCPVVEQCLTAGLREGLSGVWGGLLLEGGLPFKTRSGPRGPERLPCGTEAAYLRHRYNKQQPCPDCTRAHTETRARRRREQQERDHPCGTEAAARRHHRHGEKLCEACRIVTREVAARRQRGVKRRKPLKPCGTHAAYLRHVRSGVKPCEPCRAAHAAYKSERNHARARREVAA